MTSLMAKSDWRSFGPLWYHPIIFSLAKEREKNVFQRKEKPKNQEKKKSYH